LYRINGIALCGPFKVETQWYGKHRIVPRKASSNIGRTNQILIHLRGTRKRIRIHDLSAGVQANRHQQKKEYFFHFNFWAKLKQTIEPDLFLY
jgi:hypothetical protein